MIRFSWKFGQNLKRSGQHGFACMQLYRYILSCVFINVVVYLWIILDINTNVDTTRKWPVCVHVVIANQCSALSRRQLSFIFSQTLQQPTPTNTSTLWVKKESTLSLHVALTYINQLS